MSGYDCDTKDGCTRSCRSGCILRPLFLNERRIDLINQSLVQHRATAYRADDMDRIVHGNIEVIVHHNVVIDVCHLHAINGTLIANVIFMLSLIFLWDILIVCDYHIDLATYNGDFSDLHLLRC